MRSIFLSNDARRRESWCEAFPDLIAGRIEKPPRDAALVWVLLPAGQRADAVVRGLRKALTGRSLIVLADAPTEDEAMAALSAGAAGYCNGHAAPQVLQQVATVVENGGIWIGQGLMQRFLAVTARLLPEPAAEKAPGAPALLRVSRKLLLRWPKAPATRKSRASSISPSAPSRHTLAPHSKNSAHAIACNSR